MALIPAMWVVWGASVVLMIAVSIFSARLGRNEEDQLFLAESSNYAQSEQHAIAARVGKLRPFKRATIALASVTTLGVLAFYLVDIFKQF